MGFTLRILPRVRCAAVVMVVALPPVTRVCATGA